MLIILILRYSFVKNTWVDYLSISGSKSLATDQLKYLLINLTNLELVNYSQEKNLAGEGSNPDRIRILNDRLECDFLTKFKFGEFSFGFIYEI